MLTEFIRAVTPLTLYIPLSIFSLNKSLMYPKKNHDNNKMEEGVLQMLDGTTVVCDETTLGEGALKEIGVYNIKAIATLIE